jgi:hypothetical protein
MTYLGSGLGELGDSSSRQTGERSTSTDSADEIDRSSEEIRSVRERTQRRADRQTVQMRSTRAQRSDQLEIERGGEQIDKAVRVASSAGFSWSQGA